MNARLAAALTVSLCCTAAHGEQEATSFTEAMSVENADISLDTRVFYFDRGFDLPDTEDAEALTAGGIFKYASGDYHGFGFGIAYYASLSLFGIVDRDRGGGTALLQSDGEDISFLGEAYLDYDTGHHLFRVGRQRLATPIADDHDNRLLPTAYEAAVYRFSSDHEMKYELGYISAFSGFGSSLDDFEEPEEDWGEDGLGYAYAFGKLYGLDVRAQYVETLEDSGTNENYGYLDANYELPWGEASYLRGQLGHSGYQQEDSAAMYGLKTGTTVGKIDLALLWNAIRDNRYDTVESGPMYSDWQQGYGNYEPSDAIGAQVTFHPLEKLSLKFGYVDVESRDGDEFNLDTYSEFNIDAQYGINEAATIRLRYSDKDQDDDSDREDRDDFRIIFYYDF